MINKNNGEYSPTPVYNRRLMRNIIRNQVIKQNGYHKVNGYMSEVFKELKGGNN